jgi:hypothetical protein
VGKYDPLRDYLSARSDALPQLTLTFSDVEALVGALPDSARTHPAWWANDSRPEANSWCDAGWRVLAVDQAAERVVFARGAVGGRRRDARAATATVAPRQPSEPRTEQPSDGDAVRVRSLTGFGFGTADGPSQAARAGGDTPGQRITISSGTGLPEQATDTGLAHRWTAEARLGLEPWAAAQARDSGPQNAGPRNADLQNAGPQNAGPRNNGSDPADEVPDTDAQVRAAWPDSAAPAAPARGVVPPAPDADDAEGRHSRRARRLAAHLDASLRAATGRGFSDTAVPPDLLPPIPPAREPADAGPHGPRTPHGGTQPGRYGGGPIDPGIPTELVEAMLEGHLLDEGWTVRQPPDGRTGDYGASLTATRHNRTLAIAVRGYPAIVPARGDQSEAPAPPALRARQWYAQALLEAVLIRGAQPDVDIAVALPDVPVYRALYARSRDTFGRLNLLVFFAGADGRVRDH